MNAIKSILMFVAEFSCIFPLIKEGNSHRMQLPAYVHILSPLPKNSIKKMAFDHKGCAVVSMIILFLTALAIFPSYMKPDPPVSLAFAFSILPLSILLYSLFMTLFVW